MEKLYKETELDKQILIDAIKSIELDYTVSTFLPERFVSYDKTGEPLFDCSCLYEFNNKELRNLYFLLKHPKEMIDLYRGFDPRSEEEIEYLKAEKEYVERMKNLKVQKNEVYYGFEELADIIDFRILHSMMCEARDSEDKPDLLVSLPQFCLISYDEMCEKRNKNLEQKLHEVLQSDLETC